MTDASAVQRSAACRSHCQPPGRWKRPFEFPILFPEPDLVPLQVEQAWITRVHSDLPELPDAKRQRFVAQYGLPAYDVEVLTASRALADYYEAAVQLYPQPKAVSNWVMGDFMRELNRHHHTPQQAPVTPTHLAGMLRLVDDRVISGKIAKTVFEEMYRTGKPPADIVAEQGLVQVRDTGALQEVIQQVLTDHATQVNACRAGVVQHGNGHAAPRAKHRRRDPADRHRPACPGGVRA